MQSDLKTNVMMTASPVEDSPRYEWQQLTAQAEFAPRDGAGALVFKERLWLLGGWNPGDKQIFPDVWNSADGVRWDLVNAAVPWAQRALHYTVAFNDPSVGYGRTNPAGMGS